MGLLDQVLGGVLGSSQTRGGGGSSPIEAILKGLLTQQGGGSSGGLGGLLGSLGGGTANTPDTGGLGGLLDSFTKSGHGDIADSWVGTEQNRPVAPHQLQEVLGEQQLDNLAVRTGMSREEILAQLSQHLPNAVDQLTPRGQRPTANDMKHW